MPKKVKQTQIELEPEPELEPTPKPFIDPRLILCGIAGLLLLGLLIYLLLTKGKKKEKVASAKPEPAVEAPKEEEIAFPGIPAESWKH